MKMRTKCECCGLLLPVVKREDGWVGLGMPNEKPTDLTEDEALAWLDSLEEAPALVAVY